MITLTIDLVTRLQVRITWDTLRNVHHLRNLILSQIHESTSWLYQWKIIMLITFPFDIHIILQDNDDDQIKCEKIINISSIRSRIRIEMNFLSIQLSIQIPTCYLFFFLHHHDYCSRLKLFEFSVFFLLYFLIEKKTKIWIFLNFN